MIQNALADAQVLGGNFQPVSYTHLDVYKRQLVALGNGIAKMDAIGAGIYAFLNRLLIPTGLHLSLIHI